MKTHQILAPVFHSRNVGDCGPDGDHHALTKRHERGESYAVKIWNINPLVEAYAPSRAYGNDEFTENTGPANSAHIQPPGPVTCASKGIASQQR